MNMTTAESEFVCVESVDDDRYRIVALRQFARDSLADYYPTGSSDKVFDHVYTDETEAQAEVDIVNAFLKVNYDSDMYELTR